jgi:hypothetical protein
MSIDISYGKNDAEFAADIASISASFDRLIAENHRLRKANSGLRVAAAVALTFMSPTGHAQDMLRDAIAKAEEPAP